jgi:hypothetical protein
MTLVLLVVVVGTVAVALVSPLLLWNALKCCRPVTNNFR